MWQEYSAYLIHVTYKAYKRIISENVVISNEK